MDKTIYTLKDYVSDNWESLLRKDIKNSFKFTNREMEVFFYKIIEEKNETIAKKLFISHNTVKSHVCNIKTKIKSLTGSVSLLSTIPIYIKDLSKGG